MRPSIALLALVSCCALAACGGGGGGASNNNTIPGGASPTSSPTTDPSPLPTPAPSSPPGIGVLQHIVIIVQENRSFDNIFGGPNGFPGAQTAASGKMSTGQTQPLQQITFEDRHDILHTHTNFEAQYANGNMYFDLGKPDDPTFPYSYLDRAETAPYWSMASQYVLADHFFESNNGPSYEAHQYLIAGQSQNAVENPVLTHSQNPLYDGWGCDDPPGTYIPILVNGQEQNGPFPCFDYPTVADELDAKGISWKYYAPQIGQQEFGAIWSAFDAIKHIRYGNDWNNVIYPEQRVITDAQQTLPAVTWVMPSIGDSDHPGTGSNTGPSWVSSVVNAVGNGPNWNSTAIILFWDDWGGFYDDVVPQQVDPMGLGFRTPMIVISPYAKHGYVAHTQYEIASVLRFVEERFGLATLSAADARAASLDDAFDFSQSPRPFTTIQSRYTRSYFMHERPSNRPPDDD